MRPEEGICERDQREARRMLASGVTMMSQEEGHRPQDSRDVLGGPDRAQRDELAGPDQAEGDEPGGPDPAGLEDELGGPDPAGR
jgi:hypothetical protein